MENHGQKRSADEQNDMLDGVQALLLDIEGTTTPITFVKDKLFPYVRDNVKSYIETHFDEEECQGDIEALRTQAAADVEASVEGAVAVPASAEDNKDAVVQAIVDSVLWQMDQDRKAGPLKQLQGHMWREAYKTGLVQGEVFDDVEPMLRQWTKSGKKAFIYSSGSVEAQKLLFGYSDKGDLTELFTDFFDTAVGAKTEKDSYSNIVEATGVSANEMLFCTDLPKEAAAAVSAGMKAAVVVREGNAALSDEEKASYNTVSSFAELTGEEPAAKRVEEEQTGEEEEEIDPEVVAEDGEEEEGDGEGEEA